MARPDRDQLLFRALLTEDMYLAGTIVMFLCFLTIIGMFVSDMVLVVLERRLQVASTRFAISKNSASNKPKPDTRGLRPALTPPGRSAKVRRGGFA